MNLSNNIFKSHIPYAFSKKLNRYVGVDEVERGLKCDCICPGCRMRLVSKQGDSNIHHFAHWEEAEEPCKYSYWVSIRDMAMQILKEINYIENDKDILKCYKVPFLNRCKYVQFYNEINFNDKKGMDIFFESNLGLLGIRFLTHERERESYKSLCYFSQYITLVIDIRQIIKHPHYMKESLKNIILNNVQICTLKKYTIYEKENIEKVLADFYLKYERLYRSKSIMNMEDLKAFNLNSKLINSFEQSDFSAINIAKVYYHVMYKHFKKNKPKNQHYEVLYEDKLHDFIVYDGEFYGTAFIMNKFFIYQVIEDEIVLIGSTFKKDDKIKSIIITHIITGKKCNSQNKENFQKKYPSLF